MTGDLPATRIGAVGLGTMGSRIAGHLSRQGFDIVGYDVATPAAQDGVRVCASLSELAGNVPICFFSVPDASASLACARELASTPDLAVEIVIDLSTIGVAGARQVDQVLSSVGVGYVDAPVSGSLAAAASGGLAVMVGAPDELFDRAKWLLELIGSSVTHVGRQPGFGQAMKVINNAISGTTLAITSEALAVGCALGLDLATMLDVVNHSSGRSVASDRKFPEQVLTGAYAHGGPGSHFEKDIGLFLDIARDSGVAHRLATESAGLWHEFAQAWVGADQTEIFRYVRGEQRTPTAPGEG